jgi:hypothetical protein
MSYSIHNTTCDDRDTSRLLDIMLDGSMHKNRAEMSNIIDKLAASKLPFQESRMGGGPWVVRATV